MNTIIGNIDTLYLSLMIWAVVLGMLFVFTDIFWQFWDECDEDKIKEIEDLEKFWRGE